MLIIITIHAKDIIAERVWSLYNKQSSQTALLYLSLPIKLFIKNSLVLACRVCVCVAVCVGASVYVQYACMLLFVRISANVCAHLCWCAQSFV